MLCQAHGPTKDHTLRFNEDFSRIFQSTLGNSRLFKYVAEMNGAQRFFELIEPGCVPIDELTIENLAGLALLPIEDFFHDPFKQSDIAIDAHLHEEIGELRSASKPGPNFLRMFEARQSGFGKGIDVHNFAAASFGVEKRSQHARMIRPGILPDDKDRVGEVKVFKRYRPLAKTEGFLHSGAARFMTHVRAVRQIVRAKLSHKKLIKKCGLVAGASRSVEDRFIGRGQPIQFTRDQFKRVLPVNGFVIIAAFAQDHRMSDASLCVEPLIRLVRQFRHAPLLEKLRRHAFCRRFIGDMLRAFFAKFEMRTLAVRLRPGATRTIDSLLLI